MFSKGKTLAAATGAALAFTLAVPMGNASAIDWVQCNSKEYLHLVYEYDSGKGASWACYANGGRTNINRWVKEIHTGNNNIRYRDHNGALITYPKWTDKKFPKTVNMDWIEIV
ncbi:beta/gamma crystallin domain-containing protein [Amycolatopsis jejuensis]|uniref:beta/gamma crystallin domain-containing protein n=1 Tax=Amycolatopsis jejuensis TaxID=330084 RepID=UPI0005276621|nr:beta/gamma crystallin domain-containing protein [Amycolatopsis jejuensis]